MTRTLAAADEQKLKDAHRDKAREEQGGEKKATAGHDGLIDSDSEDEKVVQATKRKAAPAAKSAPETTETKSAPPPQKKAKSAA